MTGTEIENGTGVKIEYQIETRIKDMAAINMKISIETRMKARTRLKLTEGLSIQNIKKHIQHRWEDFLNLMRGFYAAHPEFEGIPLYIYGQSYGGKMAIDMGIKIHEKCDEFYTLIVARPICLAARTRIKQWQNIMKTCPTHSVGDT
ncbi:Retinoid-inducible serine carboxypeptidase [Eumeta japonica]|uniref:Retinoid-inducible serine carboxypeptidase n=1 Tax=Eumeta variegata TaxID=151549 RepID=A0A4C1VMT1_EUMVA|nr:Retinoid-inducible serine carboxypeptidase [Eumeta japonica]